MNQTPNIEFFDNKDHDHHLLEQTDVSRENSPENIGALSEDEDAVDSDDNDSTAHDDEQYLTTDENIPTTDVADDINSYESDDATGEIQQILDKKNNNIFRRQRQFDPDAAVAIPLISIQHEEESYDGSVFEVDLHEERHHSVNNIETSSVVLSTAEYEAENSSPKLALIEKYFPLKKSAPKTSDYPSEVLETAVRVKYIDPLSVSKISASIGVTMGFIWVLAIGLLYLLLDIFSVFDKINTSFSGANKAATTVIVSPSGVLLFSIISGFLVALFVTITSTLGAVIYNILAEFFGGILINLADDPKNKL